MATLLVTLLVQSQATSPCFSYATSQDCVSTAYPCQWSPYCSATSPPACFSYSNATSCAADPMCIYKDLAMLCLDVCSDLGPGAGCAANANCTDSGMCSSTSCTRFSGPNCPSTCFLNEWCAPSQPDTCLQHSPAVCAQNAPNCVWLAGQCQSPCWGESSLTCTTVQGCALASSCLNDVTELTCPTGNNSSDCHVKSGYRCDFNDNTRRCDLSCSNQPTQLGCVETGCMPTMQCQPLTNDCSLIINGTTCNAMPSCFWMAPQNTCQDVCEFIADSPTCQSTSGCSWASTCTAPSAPGCNILTTQVDCTDTSMGLTCTWDGSCAPKLNRCAMISDQNTCGQYPGECQWYSGGGGTPSCQSVCIFMDPSSCPSNSQCFLYRQCLDGGSNPVVECSTATNPQQCTGLGDMCQFTSACFLGGGAVEAEEMACMAITNATTCWNNPNCIFGAGTCFPKCAFLNQAQCTAQGSGCAWMAACISSTATMPWGQDPTKCSISNSPVFSYQESPCTTSACNDHWGDAALSTQCNAIAKTYCCGDNSTTCALDDQCYEHYFGDGPLCPWNCDFTTHVTETCHAVGPCLATSAAYSKSESFTSAATAFQNFDLSLASLFPPPIYSNGALCANATTQDAAAGVFWKDNLDGDLTTTIDFDFWTTDFSIAFGVAFTTEALLINATSLDAVGDCVYVASCSWSAEMGSGCSLNLGNPFQNFKYAVPTQSGAWVPLRPGVHYHAKVVKSASNAFSLTVSGNSITPVTLGPLPVGRKFTRFAVLLPKFNPTAESCIDNMVVSSSTCPGGHFATAAPVGAVPTSSPVSRAPTTNPTPPPVPTNTRSPTPFHATSMPTTSPSAPPTVRTSASATLGSFFALAIVSAVILLY